MEKFEIYIGLTDKNGITQLNKEDAINTITEDLKNIGILGFNLSENTGFWNGIKENSLKISFLNSFNIRECDLKTTIELLKEKLNQESILLNKSDNNEVFFL